MSYRRSTRYQQRIALRQRAMQEGRARARMEREVEPRWEPPELRRRKAQAYERLHRVRPKPAPDPLDWTPPF